MTNQGYSLWATGDLIWSWCALIGVQVRPSLVVSDFLKANTAIKAWKAIMFRRYNFARHCFGNQKKGQHYFKTGFPVTSLSTRDELYKHNLNKDIGSQEWVLYGHVPQVSTVYTTVNVYWLTTSDPPLLKATCNVQKELVTSGADPQLFKCSIANMAFCSTLNKQAG